MSNIIKGLIILSCLAFVLAIVTALFGFQIAGINPEGFSRTCTNSAVLAIAFSVYLKKDGKKTAGWDGLRFLALTKAEMGKHGEEVNPAPDLFKTVCAREGQIFKFEKWFNESGE